MTEEVFQESLFLSDHSYERLKARCGFSKKSAIRMARRAYQDGINESNARGSLKSYLRRQLNQKANRAVIYGEYVYLFHYQTLITVFELPNRFKKEAVTIAAQMRKPKKRKENFNE